MDGKITYPVITLKYLKLQLCKMIYLYKNYWTVKAEKHSDFHSFCLFKQNLPIF